MAKRDRWSSNHLGGIMWFVVSKKKHRAVLDKWGREERNWYEIFSEQDAKIDEQTMILNSSERKNVLADLQTALHFIQDYQRSLSLVCAADPHYTKADALLNKYGLQGDIHKVVSGFQATHHDPIIIGIDHQGKAISASTDEIFTTSVGTEQELKAQTQEDERVFGDQSYGQESATLMAERTDKGDRLFFVPKDEEAPPSVLAARITTEEASK
jgi:hypothetical protein